MKKIILSIFLLSIFYLSDVSAQGHNSTVGLDVECLGLEHDGSQTLRATGAGRNRSDAIEQAKKNAVTAVIFAGIRSGKGGCDLRPLIYEPNAREKYAEYFDVFFMDGGEYLKYTSMIDKRLGSNQKKTDKMEKSFRITVRVLRSEIKKRLINDGIIPKDGLYDVKY